MSMEEEIREVYYWNNDSSIEFYSVLELAKVLRIHAAIVAAMIDVEKRKELENRIGEMIIFLPFYKNIDIVNKNRRYIYWGIPYRSFSSIVRWYLNIEDSTKNYILAISNKLFNKENNRSGKIILFGNYRFVEIVGKYIHYQKVYNGVKITLKYVKLLGSDQKMDHVNIIIPEEKMSDLKLGRYYKIWGKAITYGEGIFSIDGSNCQIIESIR